MINLLNQVNNINVYHNGEKSTFYTDDSQFCQILTCWQDYLSTAREMPAYGVSLDQETKCAMQFGTWLEFEFADKNTYNGMPFEKLLVEINCDHSGCNLIRYNAIDGHDGRCFYLDFDHTMQKLYQVLLQTIL